MNLELDPGTLEWVRNWLAEREDDCRRDVTHAAHINDYCGALVAEKWAECVHDISVRLKNLPCRPK